jgi:hypothetical protein
MMTDQHTSLHYNWDVRPAYEPLTRKEAELALRIAEYDAERTADLLKVDVGRLMGFLRGQIDLYRQVSLRTVFPFISIRDSGEGITITIKPDRSYRRITAQTETDGTRTITLNKVSDNASHLLRVAQAVRDENK